MIILLGLTGLILYFVVQLARGREEQPQVDHRSPVDALTYCGAEQGVLCIISFSQQVDGAMQIDIQTPYAFYPEFIVTINHNGQESAYACERVEATSTAVTCTGASQVPGEVMEFKVFSKNWGTLLAEGSFAIIGIALLTPEVEFTATLEGLTTVTPTETLTVVPTLASRFNTLTPPSYPNPSYPNPSYP